MSQLSLLGFFGNGPSAKRKVVDPTPQQTKKSKRPKQVPNVTPSAIPLSSFFDQDRAAAQPETKGKTGTKCRKETKLGTENKVHLKKCASVNIKQHKLLEVRGVASTARAECEDAPADTIWYTKGHKWIGSTLLRTFGSGSNETKAWARVVAWAPALYEEEDNADAALWHVVHDDGDEEDLDRDELEAALELAAQQPEAHRERGCVAARLAAMACSRAVPAKVEPVDQEGKQRLSPQAELSVDKKAGTKTTRHCVRKRHAHQIQQTQQNTQHQYQMSNMETGMSRDEHKSAISKETSGGDVGGEGNSKAAIARDNKQMTPAAKPAECESDGQNGISRHASREMPTISSSSQGLANGLSAYERLRLANLQRNAEMMASLGLGASSAAAANAAASAARAIAPTSPASIARKRERAAARRRAKEEHAAARAAAAGPVRRSLRQRRAPPDLLGSRAEIEAARAATAAAVEAAAEEARALEEAEAIEADSAVLRYVCSMQPSAISSKHKQKAQQPQQHGSGLCGFTLASCNGSAHYADDALKRIYSVDFSPPSATGMPDDTSTLMVAGGHGGRVAVFGVSDSAGATIDEDEDAHMPLMSWRAHKGWVSSVQFVGHQSNAVGRGDTHGWHGALASEHAACSTMLVTSSNDATVALWDLRTQRHWENKGKARTMQPQPKRVTETAGLHHGGSGIFSLHALDGALLSASKDGSVALSRIALSANRAEASGGGLVRETLWDDLHAGVVKCCRLRDDHTFASCGNDGAVRVVDVRKPASGEKDSRARAIVPCSTGGWHAAHEIVNAHDGGAVNSVRWHPYNEYILATTSFSPDMRIWDLRASHKPLHSITRHHHPGALMKGKTKGIRHPLFVCDGAAVASSSSSLGYVAMTGEKSDAIALFSVATGELVSRGDIGFEPTALAVEVQRDGKVGRVAAARGGNVTLLSPVWCAK